MATVTGFLTQYEANRLLLATVGGASATYSPTANYLTPTTTVGTISTAGTELVPSSGRQSWKIASSTLTSGAMQGANDAVINFTGMQAGTISGVDNYDATTAGNRKHYGQLATARTCAAGDSLQINAAALTVSLL